MPVPVGPYFFIGFDLRTNSGCFVFNVWGRILGRVSWARIRSGWSVGCIMALVCLGAVPFLTVPRLTLAQETAGGSVPASKTSSNKTTSQTKAASPKDQTILSAKSHATQNTHPKAAVSRKGQSKQGQSKQASLRKSSKRKTTARGQQKIDPERAEAIQEALIREHYLSGEAAGTWNQASEEAMRRYQADHGWQSKTVPDSRALISLGLGPSHDHLLNPQSAMTTGPDAPRAASLTPASHSADPGSHLNVTPPPAADPAPAPSSSSDAPRPQ
jgi:hypothetical protein